MAFGFHFVSNAAFHGCIRASWYDNYGFRYFEQLGDDVFVTGNFQIPASCSAKAARSSTREWSRATRSTPAAAAPSTWSAATSRATSRWCATPAPPRPRLRAARADPRRRRRAGQDLPGEHPARQQLRAELWPAQTVRMRLGRRRQAGPHRRQQHQSDLLARGLRSTQQPHRRPARAGGAWVGRSVRVSQRARGGRLRRRRAHGAAGGGQSRAHLRVPPGQWRRRHAPAGAAGAAYLPRRRHAAELRHRTRPGRHRRRSVSRRPALAVARAEHHPGGLRLAPARGIRPVRLFQLVHVPAGEQRDAGRAVLRTAAGRSAPPTARRTSCPSTRATLPPTTGTATARRT